MPLNKTFYYLKPFIPRALQIAVRRQIALRKRWLSKHIWPIDPEAGQPPENWQGWPDQKRFALVIQHDVDTQKGHDNCRQLMGLEQGFGIRSLYSIVPERYKVSGSLLNEISGQGFELAVHGLKHDGKLFSSKRVFQKRAIRINHYLKEWHSVGFTSPSMHRNLDWMHVLNIDYCTSTFDTDPFEPQPEGVGTIFPFYVKRNHNNNGYVELPYTLSQDHLLFAILKEKNIEIWKKKIDWIAENGGMALLNTHPDYMNFQGKKNKLEEYPVDFYIEFLEYVLKKYNGQYWHVLPGDLARFWSQNMVGK